MEEIAARLDLRAPVTINRFDSETTVLFRHDDAAPEYYTMFQLQSVFRLSDELAEHVIQVARETGVAYVVTRPHKEAERLVHDARMAAQMFGFPLVFGLEHDLCRPEKDTQNESQKSAVCSLVLCFAWCLILCVITSNVP